MKQNTAAILLASLLLLLTAARFVNLDADPPLYYVQHGSAQITDPYNVTWAARNRVLFDTWNLFDINRWDVFKNSLVSAVTFVVYETAGVSRVSANVAALLLQLAGLALFLLGLGAGGLRRWAVGLVALLLLVNSHLFFYGRLPFLENGLIFLSGLLFFIFVRYHDRLWGQLLTGALLALATLAGKLFGALLLGPVVVALFYRYRARVLVPLLLTVAGAVAGAALYLIVFYGGSVATLMQYYSEQTTGMYGTPPGLTSVPNFLKMLIVYGGESGLWQFLPIMLVLTAISLVIILLSRRFDREYNRSDLPLLFCLIWLLGGILALMPFYYRPIRYSLFLLLPAAALPGYVAGLFAERAIRFQLGNRWITLPLLFIAFWYLFTQLGIFVGSEKLMFTRGVSAMPLAALLAALITGGLYLLLRNRPRQADSTKLRPLFILIVVGVVVFQGFHLYRGVARPGDYLKSYNYELTGILAPEAVVTGPYANALTIDNDLKSVVYMFGLVNVEDDLFSRFPISHIVTDQSNWQAAQKDFPFLKNSLKVAEMIVRDRVIVLYRVPDAPAPMTDFERGAAALSAQQVDSADFYFSRYQSEHPASRLGAAHMITARFLDGHQDEALATADSLMKANPDNYMLHGFCRGFYQLVYRTTNEAMYRVLSERHGERASELDPALAALQ